MKNQIYTTVRHLTDDAKDITVLSLNQIRKLKDVILLLNSIVLQDSTLFDICESEITEKDLITTLKSTPNGKSPGHDVLTKQFY